MSVIAISMVKNEIDVVEWFVRHTVDEVDRLIIADNGSTDGTRDILDDLVDEGLPLTVLDDPDPAYYQARKMTRLAEMAMDCGATWVVPIDADEIWYSREGRIRDVLHAVVGNVAEARMWNHYTTGVDRSGHPFVAMRWRAANPGALPKVAFRPTPGMAIAQGNHSVRILSPVTPVPDLLEIRHFPYRSPTQFVAKAIQGGRAYEATIGLPADMGAHWRVYYDAYQRGGPDALADHYRRHFHYPIPIDSLIHDPAPYLRWAQRTAGEEETLDH